MMSRVQPNQHQKLQFLGSLVIPGHPMRIRVGHRVNVQI